MLKDRFFQTIFGCIFLIAIVHDAGIYGGLYGAFTWFDILAHFLGGVAIGGLGLWVLLKTNLRKRFLGEVKLLRTHILVLGLAVAFLVGVGWEIFEALIDPFLSGESGYLTDTLLDLIMDSAGGLFAALLFVWLRKDRN